MAADTTNNESVDEQTPGTDSNQQTKIGPYSIIKKLGEGGMGSVFLAEKTSSGERVALKTPFFDRKNDELIIKRFLREARAAAELCHPNICPVLDVGDTDGKYYLTMAFIEGPSLSTWIQQTQDLSVQKSLEITRQLALGLQVAHEAGIVHRDLKPANIIIKPDGVPVIIDFGMARRFDGVDETMLTMSGAIVGTPGYMAPEQILANRDQIGPASDIYSLGIILYELLTGWMPFSGNLATILGSIVTDDPPPLRNYAPDVSPELEPLVARALAKNPADRYASAGQFASTIEQFQREGRVELAAQSGARSSGDSTDSADQSGGMGQRVRNMLKGAFGWKATKK